jgi:hypothetical protein
MLTVIDIKIMASLVMKLDTGETWENASIASDWNRMNIQNGYLFGMRNMYIIPGVNTMDDVRAIADIWYNEYNGNMEFLSHNVLMDSLQHGDFVKLLIVKPFHELRDL